MGPSVTEGNDPSSVLITKVPITKYRFRCTHFRVSPTFSRQSVSVVLARAFLRGSRSAMSRTQHSFSRCSAN